MDKKQLGIAIYSRCDNYKKWSVAHIISEEAIITQVTIPLLEKKRILLDRGTEYIKKYIKDNHSIVKFINLEFKLGYCEIDCKPNKLGKIYNKSNIIYKKCHIEKIDIRVK